MARQELQASSTRLDDPRDIIAPRRELFRAESLKEQQTLWLGRHALALGLPATVSSIASTVMVVAAAGLITYGSYARRVELHGLMLPTSGLVQITSPAAGWVQSLNVQDGEFVSSGTRLYSVNTDIATQGGNTQQKILESLAAERSILLLQTNRKMEIRDRQDGDLRRKIENLASQITQMGVQISVKEEFVRQTTKDFADFTGFVARGIGNLNEKLIRQQNWMHSKDELEELKSRALRLQGDLLDTQAQLSTLHLEKDNEIDGMRAKLSDLDKQVASSEARHSIEIVAPASGKVTAISSRPGQIVAAGARLLTIVPSQERMQAELLAPSTSIGFLLPGQRVLLRYSAFPYQKFGEYWGTVTEISHAALQADELKTLVPNMPPADQSKTFYRVIVAPDRSDVIAYGHSEPLHASMQVDARVLLDRRPIYQWILEPLYGLHGT